jgi:hypothetical protein
MPSKQFISSLHFTNYLHGVGSFLASLWPSKKSRNYPALVETEDIIPSSQQTPTGSSPVPDESNPKSQISVFVIHFTIDLQCKPNSQKWPLLNILFLKFCIHSYLSYLFCMPFHLNIPVSCKLFNDTGIDKSCTCTTSNGKGQYWIGRYLEGDDFVLMQDTN